MLTAGAALGRIQRAQGHLETAFRTYQEGLAFAARTDPTVVLSAAVAHVGMAEVFYERNQLEQALRHAREGISLGRQLTSTQALASGLVILAWIRQAMGIPIPLGFTTWNETYLVPAAIVEGAGALALAATLVSLGAGTIWSRRLAWWALWYCFAGILWGM